MKNCVYSRMETFGNPQFGQQITKFSLGRTKTLPDQWVMHIILLSVVVAYLILYEFNTSHNILSMFVHIMYDFKKDKKTKR